MENEVHREHHPESFSSQFERISGLSQWLTWLGLLFGISALLIATFVINEALIEYAMYLVIFGLAAGLIAKGYADAKFIDREMKLASDQVRILEEVDDFESFLERAPQSVFRSHIDNLYTISLSNPDVSQDNLIEVLHTRLMARNRVVELFSSILITLGLIGTILGLIIMMGDLTETMGGGSVGDELLAKLGDPNTGALRGLSTAFLTTLLGAIFGGVVLRVLTSVVDASIMRYTAHLAELTEVHVIPFMRQSARNLERAGQ